MKFLILAESAPESVGQATVWNRIVVGLIPMLIVSIALFALIVYLIILVIMALRRYLSSTEVRTEKALVRKTLGETLKDCRIRCNMTQEFVAEAIGVSRQAVSKWETESSDPSTSNLLALAKLYGVSAEELLKSVAAEEPPKNE